MSSLLSIPEDLKVPPDLFKDVKYYLIGNVHEKVQKLLQDGGAKQDYYMSEMITHTIADDPDADEVSEAKELFELTVVSSRWVIMSARCKCHLPTDAFEVDQDQLFIGVVACPSQLAAPDCNTVWALISYHGGRCQRTLTRDVTHLICTKARGLKYERAIRTDGAVKIVTPDWFQECVKEKKMIPEDRFHPCLVMTTPPPPPTPPSPPHSPEVLPETPPIPPPSISASSSQLAMMREQLQLPGSLPGLSPGLPNGPRPDSFRTKEMLARMVSSRLQGKLESPTETSPSAISLAACAAMGIRPGMMPGGLPSQQSPQPNAGLGQPHPGGQQPGQQHMFPSHLQLQGPPMPHQGPQGPQGQMHPQGHLPPHSQGHMLPGHMQPRPQQSPMGGSHMQHGSQVLQHGPHGPQHRPLHIPQSPTHGPPGPPHSMQGPPHGMQGPPHGMQGLTHGPPGPPHGQQLPPHGPHGPPRRPLGSPHGPLGSPHGAMGSPHGPMGSPHGSLGSPHGPQGPQQTGIHGPQGPPQRAPHGRMPFRHLQGPMQPGHMPQEGHGMPPGPHGMQQAQHGMLQGPHGMPQGPHDMPGHHMQPGQHGMPQGPHMQPTQHAGMQPGQHMRPGMHQAPGMPPHLQQQHQHQQQQQQKLQQQQQQQQQQQHQSQMQQGHMMPGQMPPGHMQPGHISPGANRATSPRTLQNITNRPDASPANRQRISQLVSSLNQPPRQQAPGRSPLAQQLEALASKGRAAAGIGPPPQQEPTYYGHDPIETVPNDICLLGCVFYITDYQKVVSEDVVELWKKKIIEHGGTLDDSYSNRVTHLLCEHQRSDVFQMALRDHKRLVTAHWLNDVLLEGRLLPPWRALHLPSIYGERKPCSNQILCVSNFEGDDRARVKQMVMALGARYTGYMSHSNSALICKQPGGIKYQRALEWRIPVVNVLWLTDLLLGKLEALKLPINQAYQQFVPNDPFHLEAWRVAPLLEGWKTPLRISKEAWKTFVPGAAIRAAEIKRQMEQEEMEVKRLRFENNGTNGASPPYYADGAPVVLITTLRKKEAQRLNELVERLGGHVTSLARPGVTHLVSRGIARTVKFLSALGIVRHVVTPEWVEQSAMENKFLDETNFVLQDRRLENELNFSLQRSLARAQEKPLFEGIMFYVTPSVIPSRKVLQEIAENAGGRMIDKRPSVRNILSQKNDKGEAMFLVISCENDIHLCRDLLLRRVAVYHSEFVMTSVLLQTVLYNQFTLTMAAPNSS